MKNHLFLRCMALAAAGLLSYSAHSQALPPGFQSQKQLEYNNMLVKEISFADFYEAEINEYQHKQALLLNPALIYVPGPVRATTCANGDFETGIDAGEWSGGAGWIQHTGVVDYSSFTAGLQSGPYSSFDAHHTSMTAGPDSMLLLANPVVTMSRVAPGGSTRSVRIGNAKPNFGAELISKTFVVTAANSNISFWYALVLQNPNDGFHTVAQQPSFKVRVLDQAGVEIPGLVDLGGGSSEAIADSTNPFFEVTLYANEALVYRDWTCAQINLASRVGQTVTVEFVTKDCGGGAHFGYAYLDNFCGDCNIGGTQGTIRTIGGGGCGAGTICCSFTVPRAPNGTTGFVKPMLHIYQNGALVTTIPGMTFSSDDNYCFNVDPATLGLASGGFDYTIEGLFNMSTGPLAPITVGNAAIGQGGGQDDDYQVACSSQCCPGTNLVLNGTFEAGNTGFSSAYTYQPVVGAGSVSTGRYAVLNSTEALTVSPTWTAACPDYGKALIVNAATETATLNKVAWRQTFNLRAGIYKFCGDFRNLAQCAFNAGNKITLSISEDGRERSSSLSLSGSAGCKWTNMESIINLTVDRTVTITILLDENMPGDGNDIAMDNFTLVRIQQVSLTDVQFNVAFSNITATSYNATATPATAMAKKCKHFWQVEEVTTTGAVVPNTQVVDAPSWTTPNTFKGYNGTNILSGTAPGVFSPSKTYRFVYGRSCPCEGLRLYGHTYGPGAAGRGTGALPPLLLSSGEYEDAEAASAMAKPVTLGNSGDAIKVFPNPTEDNVTLQMAPLASGATLKVFSSTGQEVKTISIKEETSRVEVSLKNLAAGAYLLQLSNSKGVIILNEKVIKL